MSFPHRLAPGLLLAFALIAPHAARADAPLEFHVTFDRAVSDRPFTGRVFVLLTRFKPQDLPSGPNWIRPEPFFARDVKDWKPGETVALTGSALAYPEPLAKLPKGEYWVRAVMDFDRGGRTFTDAGNGYSRPVQVALDPVTTGPVKLTIDQVIPGRKFEESERVRLVDIESKLLTAFHGRPVRLRAGVILPRSYAKEPDRRYPVVYEIPGFGGNHFLAHSIAKRNPTDLNGTEALWVVLDPASRWGHHVFADSDNNGPCGRALCEELIPAVEKTFRAIGTPAARLLTGHSSGGWSSLWLQVTYPDFFGGTWSTAPDPVDFRDFQRVNIYRPGVNLFADEEGRPRPLGRRGKEVLFYYKGFSDMEDVMGHGGQLGSFEAVFGPRDKDGRPAKLWDRRTGKIDPDVAKTWERYDIRLVLERNWAALGPKLRGKLHVYMGDMDNFYLEGATRLLGESLKALKSDAVVELFPGRDHGTLMDRELRERIGREMAEQLRRNLK